MDEAEEAFQDVADVVGAYGATVQLTGNTESTTNRDKYGSIIDRGQAAGAAPISIYSFPIRANPSTKLLESLGIREKAEILFYFSNSILNAAGLSITDFDPIRRTIASRGIVYKITARNEYSQFANRMLYTVIAGVRT